MRGADRAWWRLGVAATLITLVASACTQAVSPTDEGAEPTDEAAPAGDVVEIEWYVGLGTGENEEQIPAEQAVVDAFNDGMLSRDLLFVLTGAQSHVPLD